MSRTEFKHWDIFMYKPLAEKSIVSHCSSQYALISLVHKHYRKRKVEEKKDKSIRAKLQNVLEGLQISSHWISSDLWLAPHSISKTHSFLPRHRYGGPPKQCHISKWHLYSMHSKRRGYRYPLDTLIQLHCNKAVLMPSVQYWRKRDYASQWAWHQLTRELFLNNTLHLKMGISDVVVV